jgi:hypothetical protein
VFRASSRASTGYVFVPRQILSHRLGEVHRQDARRVVLATNGAISKKNTSGIVVSVSWGSPTPDVELASGNEVKDHLVVSMFGTLIMPARWLRVMAARNC